MSFLTPKRSAVQPGIRPSALLFTAATLLLLYLSSRVHYLLFHTLSYKGMGIFADYDFYANQVSRARSGASCST
jgi:hypothetical protein